MKKLLISVTIIVAFALSSYAAVNAAGVNKAELLGALGMIDIFDDGKEMSETVTRGEFAAIADNFVDGQSTVYSSYYSDVPRTHTYAVNITSVTKAGYMIGDDKGRFYPDEALSGSDALTVCMKILGYQDMANGSGGYTEGYIKAAQSLGLSGFAAYETMTREDVCNLLYKMLDSKVLDVEYYSGAGTSYKISGETLAEAMFQLYNDSGRVTATPVTSLTSEEGTAQNQVKIDDVLYDTELNVVSDIGKQVSFWYKDDGDDKTLVYMYEDSKDTELILDGRDIDNFNEYIYTYKDGSKTAKISLGVSVIYNGCYVRMDDLSADELVPADGEVRLISTNGSKLYDIAVITNYEYYTVQSVSTTDNIIYGKYDKPSLDMDNEDGDRYISFDAYGKTVALSYFKENDIIQVYKSKNSKIINVSMVTAKEQGSPQMIDIDDDKISINGTEYDMLRGLADVIKDASGAVMREEITLNSNGSFYVNTRGVVVGYVPAANTEEQVGFLISVRYIPYDLEYEALGVRLLVGTEPKLYLTTEKIYYTNPYDGARKKYTASELYEILPMETETKVQRDVYLFKLNEDGLITELIAPMDMTGKENYQGYSVDVFAKDWDRTGVRVYTQKIGTRYIPDGATKVFKVPVDSSAADSVYETGTMSSFFGSDTRNLHLSVYGSDADSIPKAVVWWSDEIGGSSKVKSSIDAVIRNNPLVITKKVKTYFEDESEEGYILKGYQGGSEVEFEVTADCGGYSTSLWGLSGVGIEDLSKGDVIHYETNSQGQIEYILPLFVQSKRENAKAEVVNSGAIYDYDALAVMHTLHGRVVRSSSSTITVNAQADLNAAYNRTYSATTANVILVEDGEVKKISLSDVRKGDEVFIRDYHHLLYDVVVYR